MCNLLKILKQLGNKPTVKDIEVNDPEVVQPKQEDIIQVKPIDSTTIKRNFKKK